MAISKRYLSRDYFALNRAITIQQTADAVELFDVIQTLDREKLAVTLAQEMKRQDRRPELFIQVNTGVEPQKAGVMPAEADAFIQKCLGDYDLPVVGLMCIPPRDENLPCILHC